MRVAEVRLSHWDRAVAHLNRALEQLPGDLRLKLERGRCLVRLGRHEQAAGDFSEVLRVKLQTLQGRAVPGEGQFLAFEELEAVSEAYHDLATAQREAGLLDEATATYHKILALWPGHPAQLFRVARGLERCLPRQPATGAKKNGDGSAPSHEELAIDALKQAALAAFTDSRQARVAMSFEPLKSRPEYRALVQQLERSEVLAAHFGRATPLRGARARLGRGGGGVA